MTNVGNFRHLFLRGVEPRFALAHNASAVAQSNVPDACCHEKLCDGNACRARAVDDDLDVLFTFACQFKSVDKRSGHDNCRAVLIVVKHGDVQFLLQSGFDFEAPRRRDVLEIYAAERSGQQFYRANDFFGILGLDAQRISVNVAVCFEQRAFAFHDGHACLGADVAKPEYRRAVGNDRDGIPATSKFKRLVYVVPDCQARFGNARSVRHRQGFVAVYGHTADRFDFSAPFGVLFKRNIIVIHMYLHQNHTIRITQIFRTCHRTFLHVKR